MQQQLTSLGCEVVAILSDHSYRALDVIVQELASAVPTDRLQQQLDQLAADGVVRRHFVGDACLYRFEGVWGNF